MTFANRSRGGRTVPATWVSVSVRSRRKKSKISLSSFPPFFTRCPRWEERRKTVKFPSLPLCTGAQPHFSRKKEGERETDDGTHHQQVLDFFASPSSSFLNRPLAAAAEAAAMAIRGVSLRLRRREILDNKSGGKKRRRPSNLSRRWRYGVLVSSPMGGKRRIFGKNAGRAHFFLLRGGGRNGRYALR